MSSRGVQGMLSHRLKCRILRRYAHFYLVADFEAVADIERAIGKYVKQHYATIFVNELAAWWLDEALYARA